MTEYRSPLIDPITRTLSNLAIIEERYDCETEQGLNLDQRTAFEVTELLNSFLSVLAHPWEKLFRRNKLAAVRIPSDEYRDLGFPSIQPVLDDNTTRPTTLSKLLRFLRNGIAHGNIEFYTRKQLYDFYGIVTPRDEIANDDDIAGAVIWNIVDKTYTPPSTDDKHSYSFRDLAIAVTVDDMRAILTALSRMSGNPEYREKQSNRISAKETISKNAALDALLTRLRQEGKHP